MSRVVPWAVAVVVLWVSACSGGAPLAGTPRSAGGRGGEEGGCRAISPCPDEMYWDEETCRCVPVSLGP